MRASPPAPRSRFFKIRVSPMLRFLLAGVAAVALAPVAYAQTTTPPTRPTSPPAAPPQPGAAPSTEVQGVTVTAQRPQIATSIDSRTYNVANDLQTTSGSVADALRNVPSVEVDVQGNVSLRGDPNVRILIDGRPSGLFNGEGRADALQNLPADQIERVEVSTNPSAAMSPEGSGGVINLITRRNRRAGQFGTVRANIGTDGRINGGISGAYTSERMTLSGDLGLRRELGTAESTLDRRRNVGTGVIASRQDAESENESVGFQMRLSAEYNLDANNRVNAQFRAFGNSSDSTSLAVFEEDTVAGNLARAFERRGEGEFDFLGTEVSAGWRRTFSGEQHELTADLALENDSFERRFNADILNILPASSTLGEDIGGTTDEEQVRLKVDYNRPLSDGGRLRTGLEIETTEADFDNFGFRGAGARPLPIDLNLTDRFLYERTINAAYVTYQRPFGRLTALAGLRVEQVELNLDSITLDRRDERDDVGVYPSLNLSFAATDEQTLTASYSLRIQRPRPDELNPFIVYQDPFNLRSGNPDLEDTETHSFEAGYQYRRAQTTYLATLYHRTSDNGVTEVVRDLGGGVFLTTRDNLSERSTTGVELVANGRFSPEWTYNVSGNAFYEQIGASALGIGEDQEGFSASVRGSLNWQPTPNDFFQIQGFLRGRQVLPQGYREPSGVVNLGYRRKVNDQLSLVATARDVFGTFNETLVLETPAFTDRIERSFSQRALFVGFTYNFGGSPPQRREPGFEFETGAAPGG